MAWIAAYQANLETGTVTGAKVPKFEIHEAETLSLVATRWANGGVGESTSIISLASELTC